MNFFNEITALQLNTTSMVELLINSLEILHIWMIESEELFKTKTVMVNRFGTKGKRVEKRTMFVLQNCSSQTD